MVLLIEKTVTASVSSGVFRMIHQMSIGFTPSSTAHSTVHDLDLYAEWQSGGGGGSPVGVCNAASCVCVDLASCGSTFAPSKVTFRVDPATTGLTIAQYGAYDMTQPPTPTVQDWESIIEDQSNALASVVLADSTTAAGAGLHTVKYGLALPRVRSTTSSPWTGA